MTVSMGSLAAAERSFLIKELRKLGIHQDRNDVSIYELSNKQLVKVLALHRIRNS